VGNVIARPPDSALLLGFGGPNGPTEVLPFLRRVTAGRGVPDERLAAVGIHYDRFGGISPIRAQHAALTRALRAELVGHVVVTGANRHSEPEIGTALQALVDAGCERTVVVLTSAYSSYSGCRSYREELDRMRALVPGAPVLDVARKYHLDEGFLAPFIDGTLAALDRQPAARLVFTAHSIPTAQAASCRYVEQLTASATVIAGAVGHTGAWDLVWQSRSGPPSVPWLEPDVNDHVRGLAAGGVGAVVVVPIGFVSDHMEVVWDLDTELAETCAELGVALERVATPGIDPRFVAALAGLVLERVAEPDVTGAGCPDGEFCCLSAGGPPGRPR
jgi:ferrochelatase